MLSHERRKNYWQKLEQKVNSETLKTLSLLRGRKARVNSDGIETSLIQGSTSGTQLKVSHKNFSKSQATPFSAWCIVSIGLLSGKFSIIANNVEAPRIPKFQVRGHLGLISGVYVCWDLA